MNNDRYRGKPLLRLLECYVPNCIGELSTLDERNLIAMQPKLAQVYGTEGTWDQIVATTMEFPDSMSALIQDVWEKNQMSRIASQSSLNAQQFAEQFVDQNFVS